MRMPNCQKAVVAIEKIRDYCLSDSHPKGKHKAKVFYAVFGITAKDAEILRSVLVAASCDATAILTETNEYGRYYNIDVVASINNRTGTVCSAWIIRVDEDFPRLVTCYVL